VSKDVCLERCLIRCVNNLETFSTERQSRQWDAFDRVFRLHQSAAAPPNGEFDFASLVRRVKEARGPRLRRYLSGLAGTFQRADSRLFSNGPLLLLVRPSTMSQNGISTRGPATGSPVAALQRRVPLASIDIRDRHGLPKPQFEQGCLSAVMYHYTPIGQLNWKSLVGRTDMTASPAQHAKHCLSGLSPLN
jgi:hypothetical protein